MIPSLHSAGTWPVLHTRKKTRNEEPDWPIARLSRSGGIPSDPEAFPFLTFFMALMTSSRVGSLVCTQGSSAAVADSASSASYKMLLLMYCLLQFC